MRLVERRIGLLFALFLLLLGAATARATWIGTVKAGSLGDRAVQQQVEDMVVPARRGSILDRNGMELAVSEDAVTVFAHPFLIDNPVAVAARLAPLLGRSEDDLLKQLSDRDSSFVYLRHKMDASVGHKIDAARRSRASTPWSSPSAPTRRATSPRRCSARSAPRTPAWPASSTPRRTRSAGRRPPAVVKDALGEPVSLIETERAEAGEDIQLTLDAAIQERVEAVLGEVGQTYQPAGATAVVMDPRTGAILALANWPRVDANDPAARPTTPARTAPSSSTTSPARPSRRSRSPGALEEGLIGPDTMLDVPFEIQVADRTIGEAHEAATATLTVAEILARSSNVGTVMIGLKLGATRFDRWVRRFGFSKPTGVDLPGEERGIVLDVKDYSGSSLGNMPIGQGLSVTPIQMAAGFTAIANGGVKRQPYIVAGDRKPGQGACCRARRRRGVAACSRACSRRAAPRRGGLGPGLHAGRQDRHRREGRERHLLQDRLRGLVHRLRAGRNPRLLVSVMVDEPRGDIYGGKVAAPAFERIMEFALPYLKIPPE